jgi:hypothetical protein
MMKHKIVFTLLSLLLAASLVQAQKQQSISEAQCRSLFPFADDYQIWRTADGTRYCEAWQGRGEDPRVLIGYVFQRTFQLADKETALIIGVDTRGRITEVKTEKPTAATAEFLAQFKGRSLEAGFAVAKTAEDLLYLPRQIVAMKDNVETSERIAKAVHETLLSANNSLALASAN